MKFVIRGRVKNRVRLYIVILVLEKTKFKIVLLVLNSHKDESSWILGSYSGGQDGLGLYIDSSTQLSTQNDVSKFSIVVSGVISLEILPQGCAENMCHKKKME